MKLIIANIALFLIGITLQAHTATTEPTCNPDQLSVTRYTGIGYNALYANPDGEFSRADIDPGILSTRIIFHPTCSEGKQVSFQGTSMQVPDQVEFAPYTVCVRSASADVYSGQTSYQEKLSRSVDHSLIGNYASILSAQFSLSDAMTQMRRKTENERSVVVQKTSICNYGEARYKLANAWNNTPGYELTIEFKNAVRQLPSSYSLRNYVQFLDDWGTHIIERASVGTRRIYRSSATYMDVYEFLSQESSTSHGVGVGISLHNGTIGGGASLSLSSAVLDSQVDYNTQLGTSFQELEIGTPNDPFPTDISIVPIHRALDDSLWPVHEQTSIRQKRTNLQRALTDYVRNKRAQIAPDPSMLLEFQWPRGQFSLLKPSSGCPAGMSWGWRYQDNQDESNRNTWSPYDIDSCVDITLKANLRTNFCTKESESGSLSWPSGIYCIAKHGGSCPHGFREGSIYWDDEDNSNDNNLMEPVPSGRYDHNTRIDFCCRNDGNHNTPITLPPTEPFALYRYYERCQRVRGMNEPMELWVHSDDEDISNGNRCTGNHPDASCNHNQKLHYCYYTPQVMNRCRMTLCTTGGHTICEPTGQTCNAYNCRCERNSSETDCLAKLRVKARYARNLRRNVDGPSSICDPYMKITAYRLDGPPVTKKTQRLLNDVNPDWNEWFNFGRGEWKRITVSIWDDDKNNADDRLSTEYTMNLLMGGYNDQRFEGFDDGYGIFNYRLTI